jgi:L-fuconolactonase
VASAALARHDTVVVKISGAGTLAKEPFPYKDIRDPLRRIFDAFGIGRCMWGTDWTRAVADIDSEGSADAPAEAQQRGRSGAED